MIPHDVVQEFRESLKSESASRAFHLKHPDFCESTMSYFEKMGHFAERAATKEDLNDHMRTVTDVLERQTARLNEHDRRINSVDARLKQVEFMCQHVTMSLDTGAATAKQQLALCESISARVDELRKPASKVPWQAWAAVALGVFLSAALLTGQLESAAAIFKGLTK